MTTRTELFNLWSNTEGYGFFLGHNKMRHENSVNMLAKVVEVSAILEKKDVPNYRKQKFPYSGNVTLGMLAMQPNELFPYLFQRSSAILQINVLNRGSIFVLPDEQIKKVKEIESQYIGKVLKGALTYTLLPDLTRKVNVDIVDQSKVYVKINKNAMLELRLNLNRAEKFYDAAAYRIWDEEQIEDKNKFEFYFKNNKDETRKIEITKIDIKKAKKTDETETEEAKKTEEMEAEEAEKTEETEAEEKFYMQESKLIKWICFRMKKSSNAYDTWYDMLAINKKKAKQKSYDAEKVEYLQSILSWSLNSYVMLQKQNEIPKLSYLDLQYADRELKKL